MIRGDDINMALTQEQGVKTNGRIYSWLNKNQTHATESNEECIQLFHFEAPTARRIYTAVRVLHTSHTNTTR